MVPWLRRASDRLPDTRRALGADSPAPGLLAAGGELTSERLAEAYSKGVFPWFSTGQPVLWWSPEPRMVLHTAEFRLARSLRKTIQRFLRTPGCEVRFDGDFDAVIAACAATPRPGQDGTWIVPDMVAAYRRWHREGAVHSVETWIDGQLAGGLYGVRLGRMFFGESMFAHRSDASKIALAALVAYCRANRMPLIDCQQNTAHLASFGARGLARAEFEAALASLVGGEPTADWTYDPAHWRQLMPGWSPGDAAEQDPAQ